MRREFAREGGTIVRAIRARPKGFKLELIEPDAPEGCGECVVRVRRALVTSADLDAPDAIIAGHAGVGVVEQGERSWVGKRVVWTPVLSCGTCDLCKGGLAWHCRTRRGVGLRVTNGCLAERLVLPARSLIEVPSSVDDDRAALAVPVGAAVQLGHAARVEGKTFVTVLGDGLIGLLTAQIFAARNASVRLLGRHEGRFALAERWGVRHRREGDAGRRGDQDLVIDCTGVPDGLMTAAGLVRPRGTILVKGPPLGSRASHASVSMTEAELTIVGSCASNVRGGLELLSSGAIDVLPMLSRAIGLDEAAASAREAIQSRAAIVVFVTP